MLSTLLLVLLATMHRDGAAAPEERDRRPVLITVDDLPIALGRLHTDPQERERITHDLLDVLAKHKIRAIGFVTWQNMIDDRDRDLLRKWLDAGHELGNHTNAHLNYTRTAIPEYVADAEKGRRELAGFLRDRLGDRHREETPARVRFFRFPFLREGDTEQKLDAMRAYLAESGQRNVPVTLDTQDWLFEEPWVEARRQKNERELARIGEEYQDMMRLEVRAAETTGDALFGRQVPQVLLVHANEVGAAQWDRFFTWLRDRGYRFAAADEVLADPVFSEPHRFVGHVGPGLWDRLAEKRRVEKDLEEVRGLIQTQVAAWNRGDLEAFTSVYADDAAFLSPTGLTRGRAEVLERYRRRYPDRQTMGLLSLEPVEMRTAKGFELSMTGSARPSRVHGVSVVAKWRITYPEDPRKKPAEGLTLIVLRRTRDSWEIAQDASM